MQSLEIGKIGLTPNAGDLPALDQLGAGTAGRLFDVMQHLRQGTTADQIHAITKFDHWIIRQLQDLIATERELVQHSPDTLPRDLLLRAKQEGFGDAYIAKLLQPADGVAIAPLQVRALRKRHGVTPAFYQVDTCAAEFESSTPYLYSNYDGYDESAPQFSKPKIMILGGGPNRIGQGIEFDYCCVHACYALRDLGYETIMVNCNPETVSTDYDTADRLYFEPLTLEHVLNVWENESGILQGESGDSKPVPVLCQFGGQTPLNLAQKLKEYGVPVFGTSPEAIALAEDREQFAAILEELDITQPENGTAMSLEEAKEVAHRIGYPVLVRPSYVLGGRAMGIVYDDDSLKGYIAEATRVSPDAPVLIDRYLEDAFEIDVDAVADGEEVVIGGIMQHIEEAGVHSGDSACVLPPFKVSEYHLNIIRDYVQRIGLRINVRGLMNVQLAIKDDVVYVLEVNPRASRTTPFVSKATGAPLAKIAARIAAGQTLKEIGFTKEPKLDGFFVKEVVLPFNKFPGAFYQLGPEMRSTGEVMGHASTFGHAFAKAEMGAGGSLPTKGGVLITVNDFDKGAVTRIAKELYQMGFAIYATAGTAAWLNKLHIPAIAVNKVSEGSPHVVDLITRGQVQMLINTPLGRTSFADSQAIRYAAVMNRVPLLTTLSAAAAAVQGIRATQQKEFRVRSLQVHHHL